MVVAFENPSDDQSIGRSVYLRTALLLIGWAIVRLDSRKTKSLGSVLCGITCSLTGVCALAMHFTHWHEDVMTRLIFVGLCLGAGLILLDRRADGWSP